MYTLEVTTKSIGKRVGHQCLSQSRVIFEQKVTIGEDIDEYVVDNVALSDNYLLYFSADRISDCADSCKAFSDLWGALVLF